MSKPCKSFLSYVRNLPDIQQPADLDDAADVLSGMGTFKLYEICQTNDSEVKAKLIEELNELDMDGSVTPWIDIILGGDLGVRVLPNGETEEWQEHLTLSDEEYEASNEEAAEEEAKRDYLIEFGNPEPEIEEDVKPDEDDDDDEDEDE